jgi:hypothetical protein
LLVVAATACGGGGPQEEPVPVTGFEVLSGKTVVVLPVQYVRQVEGGWPGSAASARDAARAADAEITFALEEHGGRAIWITPEMVVEALERQPTIQGVNPYLMSADVLRREGGGLQHFRDPLFGEVRKITVLTDTRYVLWPLEVMDVKEEDGEGRLLAIRTFLLDSRAGTLLNYSLILGDSQPPASAGALAAAAQAFAAVVSP